MPAACQSREVTEPQRDLSAKLTEGENPTPAGARCNAVCSKIEEPTAAGSGDPALRTGNDGAFGGPMKASAPADKGIVATPKVGLCVGRDAHIAPQSAVPSGIGVAYYRAFFDMLLLTTGR